MPQCAVVAYWIITLHIMIDWLAISWVEIEIQKETVKKRSRMLLGPARGVGDESSASGNIILEATFSV